MLTQSCLSCRTLIQIQLLPEVNILIDNNKKHTHTNDTWYKSVGDFGFIFQTKFFLSKKVFIAGTSPLTERRNLIVHYRYYDHILNRVNWQIAIIPGDKIGSISQSKYTRTLFINICWELPCIGVSVTEVYTPRFKWNRILYFSIDLSFRYSYSFQFSGRFSYHFFLMYFVFSPAYRIIWQIYRYVWRKHTCQRSGG